MSDGSFKRCVGLEIKIWKVKLENSIRKQRGRQRLLGTKNYSPWRKRWWILLSWDLVSSNDTLRNTERQAWEKILVVTYSREKSHTECIRDYRLIKAKANSPTEDEAEELSQQFTEKAVQMASDHVVITTTQYALQNGHHETDDVSVGKKAGNRELPYCMWECQLPHQFWEALWPWNACPMIQLFTPRCLPSINGYINESRHVCKNVWGSTTPKSSKLATAHVPIKNYMQPHGGISQTWWRVEDTRHKRVHTANGMKPFPGSSKKGGGGQIPSVRSQGGGFPWLQGFQRSFEGSDTFWCGSGCWFHGCAHFVHMHWVDAWVGVVFHMHATVQSVYSKYWKKLNPAKCPWLPDNHWNS